MHLVRCSARLIRRRSCRSFRSSSTRFMSPPLHLSAATASGKSFRTRSGGTARVLVSPFTRVGGSHISRPAIHGHSMDGPFSHGDIDEHFDRRVLAEIAAGRGSQLAKLTSADLLAHGEIELRSWIVALGALGDIKPSLLEYAPLFRAIMGMGVAAWPAPVSTAI